MTATLLRFNAATRFLLLLLFFASSGFHVTAQTDTTTSSPNLQAYADKGLPNPTVTSDKEDYSPGMTAYITGSGWTLDE